MIADEETAACGPASSSLDGSPWIFAGRYEIRALLGAGGMGTVYAAGDRELGEDIAIKMMRPGFLDQPDMVERFRREVRLARRISHPNVVRVYDLGEADDIRYMTMERISGRALGDLIYDGGPLDPASLANLARCIADGLAAAHGVGVIHRDLKPDNVVVETGGRAVLTDFGIARGLYDDLGEATQSGIGTPAYMAPELFKDLAAADGASDVYSLGCVLFEAATGVRPFDGSTPGAVIEARLRDAAPDARKLRPGLPAELAALIGRCLERDQERRFPSAAAVAHAVSALSSMATIAITRPRASLVRKSGDVPPALTAPARSSEKSVAVLPFIVGSEDGHLSAGLHESMIAALSRLAALRVRALAQCAAVSARAAHRSEVARLLDAQVLVEGTLERRGSRVTVAARAYAVGHAFPLWSGRFETEMEDFSVLGRSIASGVARALAVTGPDGAEATPWDPRVADLVMRGKVEYHGFWHPFAARALGLFEEALALAPSDPAALAGCCLAALRVSIFSGEGLDRARNAEARLRIVAPDAPEARLARASLSLRDSDVISAVVHAKSAVLAAPELAEAQGLLGRILIESDMIPEGMVHLEYALRLDPKLWLTRRDLTRAHALLHCWDEVDRAEDPDGEARAGRWLDLARYTLWRRDAECAARHLAAFPAREGPGPLDLARSIFQIVSGEATATNAEVFMIFSRQVSGSSRQAAFIAQIQAEVAGFEGRRNDALAAVKASEQAGLTDLAWLTRCPLLAPVRESRSFALVVRRVGAIAARVREALFED